MKKHPSQLPHDSIDTRRSFLRLALGSGAGAVIGGGLLSACGGGDPETADGRAQPLSLTTGCVPQSYPFIDAEDGQTLATLTLSNNATDLLVTIEATTGCDLKKIFLWVGSDPTTVPNSGSGINVDDLPYDITDPASPYQLAIPLTSISLPSDPCTQPLYIFAKVITTCGFGWASGGLTGYNTPYLAYQLCGLDCTGLQGCETAFAKGRYVFASEARANPEGLSSLRLTRNRWGWAIRLASTGTSTYDIYAGAGLNNTANGQLVGSVTINWNGTTAVVTYNLVPGARMTEAHLYAGRTAPTTIAPGQYGNNASFTTPVSSYTFTVELSGTGSVAWFIAHAVVC
jgi:hypothetical protein